MTKAMLIKLLKLALVVGLMVVVVSRVQWDDHLVRRVAGVESTEVVRIEGQWTDETVVVVRADGTEQKFLAGRQPDGSEVDLAPGFWTYCRNINVLLFAIAALCYFATVMLAGARWWWLLRVNGLEVSLGQALRFTWIGVFFNNIFLGSTGGDVIKALYIMKRCPGQRVPALVSVIVDRVLGLTSLAILGALVVLFAIERFADIAIAIWSVIGGLSVLAAIAFSRRLRGLVRLKWLLDRLPARVGNLLKMFDQAVFFYRGHKRVIFFSILAGVGNHVVSVMSVVLVGDALGIGMPWTEYFVLIPVINIVSVVPLMPNGWGLGEWLYQKLFATYGAGYVTGIASAADAARIMGTRAFALSVLYRLHTTIWSLLGGVLVLFERNRITKEDIAEEAALNAADSGPPQS
jgi:hypothetical protein